MNIFHHTILVFLFLLTIPLFSYQPNEVILKNDKEKLNIQLNDISALSEENSENIKLYNSKITVLNEDDVIRNRQKRQATKKPSKIIENKKRSSNPTRKTTFKTSTKRSTTKKPIDLNEYKKNLIKDINKKRHIHNSPPLVEDAKIAQDAQNYANFFLDPDNLKAHRNESYGELFLFSDINDKRNPVDIWYGYSKGYNYKYHSLGLPVSFFTQLIWKSSSKIGCGVAKDNKERIIFCFIWPKRGEYMDYFKNVLEPNSNV